MTPVGLGESVRVDGRVRVMWRPICENLNSLESPSGGVGVGGGCVDRESLSMKSFCFYLRGFERAKVVIFFFVEK